MSKSRLCRTCFEPALYETPTGFYCKSHAPDTATFIGPDAAAVSPSAAVPPSSERGPDTEISEVAREDRPVVKVIKNLRFLTPEQRHRKKVEGNLPEMRKHFTERAAAMMGNAHHAMLLTMNAQGVLELAFMTTGDKLTLLGLLDLGADAVRKNR